VQVVQMEENVKDFGITYFGMEDKRQGIVHIIGPEQGFTFRHRQLPDNFKTISKIYIFTKTDKTRVALNKTSSLHRRRVCSGSDDG